MSRKNLGSSIDDFLKDEGIFEEAQAQAIKEVGVVAAGESSEEEKDLKVADGGPPQNKPLAGRSHSRPEV